MLYSSAHLKIQKLMKKAVREKQRKLTYCVFINDIQSSRKVYYVFQQIKLYNGKYRQILR